MNTTFQDICEYHGYQKIMRYLASRRQAGCVPRGAASPRKQIFEICILEICKDI
jgi:hypothetical protein